MDGAIERYAKALALDSRLHAAWGNMGVALRSQGHAPAALACQLRALALHPNDPGTLSNLGNALRDCGRLAEAEAVLKKAVEIKPEAAEYWNNLGLVWRDANHPKECLSALDKALSIRPDYPEAAWDRALTLMMLNDYKNGFPAYESRWRLEKSPPRAYPYPRWQGEPLAGKFLFLHDEQGFGDALQFARFVSLLAAQGARIVMECQPELARLFKALPGVAQVVPRGTHIERADYWAPLLSLPGILGLGTDDLMPATPYLKAVSEPKARLIGQDRFKVGLVWAGKMTPRDRSIELERLLPLAADPRVLLVSLQIGPRKDDIEKLHARPLIADLSPAIQDFADTAALLAQLDLLVTIDTATAHLAGAMGIPTFLMLLYYSDWRWGPSGESTPWYASLRLFRQARYGDWQAPLEALQKAFYERLNSIAPRAKN
ncbi:MAG: glycosyltransferase family protein [Alphaproteobacteria bacterium]|nr:glycosyltransferase family protein [Alphaproteobacteria bacterium]